MEGVNRTTRKGYRSTINAPNLCRSQIFIGAVRETEMIADPKRKPHQDDGDSDKRKRGAAAVRERIRPTLAIVRDEPPDGHGLHRMVDDADRAVVNAGRDAEQNHTVLCAEWSAQPATIADSHNSDAPKPWR